MSETVLLQGFLTAMLWTVEATLLLLMAGGLTRSFRNSAGLRHLIWLTAFCGLLLIPCLSILVPPLVVVRTPTTDSIKTLLDKSNSQKWMQKVTHRLPAKVTSSLPHSSDTRPIPSRHNDTEAQTKLVPTRRYGHQVRLALLSLWIAGVVAVSISGIGAMYGLFLLRRRSADSLLDPEYLEELSYRVGLHRNWELRIGTESRPAGAMTWGIFRPIILLPKEAMSWPQDRLEAVLLHELAHVHRNDCASQLLMQIVCALYWFHPAVWLAARAMRADAEIATDDSVLCSGIKPSTYAMQLLWFAAHLGNQRQPFSGIGVSLMKESKIESRIQSIVASSHRRYTITSADVLKAGSIGLITMMLFAAVRPAASSGNSPQEPLAALKPTPMLSTLRQAVRPLVIMIRPQAESKPPRSTRKSRVRKHTVSTHRSVISPDVSPQPKPHPMPNPDAHPNPHPKDAHPDAHPNPHPKDVWIKPHSADGRVKPSTENWVKPHSPDGRIKPSVEGWIKPHSPDGRIKPHTQGWTKSYNGYGLATLPEGHAFTLTGSQPSVDNLQTTNGKLTGLTFASDKAITTVNRTLTSRSAQASTGRTLTVASPDVVGYTRSGTKNLGTTKGSDTIATASHPLTTSSDRVSTP